MDTIDIGYLGEIIVANMLGLDTGDNTFEYDLISKKNKKLEVKSITCKDKPFMNYLATVNSHLEDDVVVHKQNADYYIFTRIHNDLSKAWIVGWISCDEFFKLGTFVPKGTDFGTFKFELANATVLEINKLKQFPNTFGKDNKF